MVNKHIFSLITTILILLSLAGCSSSTSKNKTSEVTASETQSEKLNNDSKETDESKGSDVAANSTDTNTEIEKNNSGNKAVPENTKEDKNNNDTKRIINNGAKKKIIVIDAGHGGKSTSEKEPVSPDSKTLKPKNVSGASGVSTGTPEHLINLNVALKLQKYLVNNGYTVILTRTSNSQTIGNIDRAEMGNNNNADLVIRIHADSSTNTSVRGASMLVPGGIGYAKDIAMVSKKYGEIILNTLVNEVGMKNKGTVTRTDLTGFNWSKEPVVLIEMGFLSNPEEDRLLSSDSYQEKIAFALSEGIEEAIGN